MIHKTLKPVKDLPCNYFFARLRYEPMILKTQKIADSEICRHYFSFPEASLKVLPVLLNEAAVNSNGARGAQSDSNS